MSSTAAQSENRETTALSHDYSPEDNVQRWLTANLNEDIPRERPMHVASCTSFFVRALSTLRFPRRKSLTDSLPVMSTRNLGSFRTCAGDGAVVQCTYNKDQEL